MVMCQSADNSSVDITHTFLFVYSNSESANIIILLHRQAAYKALLCHLGSKGYKLEVLLSISTRFEFLHGSCALSTTQSSIPGYNTLSIA